MTKFPEPFFRNGRGWYVQFGKQQIKLGDGAENSDPEAATPKRYHEVMAGKGRPLLPHATVLPSLKSSKNMSTGV